MADSMSAAAEAAPIPDQAAIERAEAFTRERFVHDGEDARRRARPWLRPAPRARGRAARDRCRRDGAVDEVAPALRAAARPRARAQRGRAAPGRRRAAEPPPGRRALGHADRAAGRRPERPRPRRRRPPSRCSPSTTSPSPRRPPPRPDEPDEDDDEPELEADEDDDEDDDEPGRGRRRGRRRRRRGRGRRAEPDEDDDEDDEPEDVWEDDEEPDVDEDVDEGAADDPNAHKRFWFEHATGAGKTVAAMGFVEASRTGGVLILTHRRNLVDQFLGELHDRGYAERESPPLLDGDGTDRSDGPVTVETYQWFVRNAGRISDAYTIVICDEAHTALGEKTSAAIRAWTGPIFIGMTATGALIARHVTDLFPTQTSRFDLAQAARRGVIAPLRCIRIPPGPGRAHDREGAAAPRRRRRRVRPGDAGRAAGPAAVQHGDRQPLQDALQRRAGRRLRRRRAPRLQRRRGDARGGHQGPGRLGRDAQARAGRDPRRATSAATSTSSSTPSCWPRAGTRRARRSACTWRPPPRGASTSSASAA